MPFKDPEKRKKYHAEYAIKWRKEHTERYRETARKYRQANKDKINARMKEIYNPQKARIKHLEYMKNNYDSYRKSRKKSYLKWRFNITPQKLKQLMVEQKGVCAICGQPETAKEKGKIRRLSIDHNHKTGSIRGLLCTQCNNGLGRFKDKPELLISAANYLMKQETKDVNSNIA